MPARRRLQHYNNPVFVENLVNLKFLISTIEKNLLTCCTCKYHVEIMST